jgi:hypothetical protein
VVGVVPWWGKGVREDIWHVWCESRSFVGDVVVLLYLRSYEV